MIKTLNLRKDAVQEVDSGLNLKIKHTNRNILASFSSKVIAKNWIYFSKKRLNNTKSLSQKASRIQQEKKYQRFKFKI